ncbi:MAG: endoglucanase [Proteobacteria bacterium]|nr:endoglucanase [Pseudomonadota bacterium]
MSIWRTLFCLGCCLIMAGCQPRGVETVDPDWQTFKSRFIATEGRVIDTGNGGISHSEGQGYGMLLAVQHNDQETFQTLWQWTRANLQVRNDKLFIWRKRPNVELKDEDPNDASDGDTLIAWALLKAGEQWQQADYRDAALAILADIKHKLIVSWHGLTVLLPGEQGFVNEGAITVNLSYWVYPALKAFTVSDPDPIWQQLSDSGLTLLQQARYGHRQLPPDWLKLKSDNTMEAANNKRFGYDAVRIPLYLALGGMDAQALTKFADYWAYYQGYTPAWIDLSENVIDGDGASVGMEAVKQLTLWRSGRSDGMTLKPLAADQDYYSSTLLMLSKLGAKSSL